jgi:hypothetical protein
MSLRVWRGYTSLKFSPLIFTPIPFIGVLGGYRHSRVSGNPFPVSPEACFGVRLATNLAAGIYPLLADCPRFLFSLFVSRAPCPCFNTFSVDIDNGFSAAVAVTLINKKIDKNF